MDLVIYEVHDSQSGLHRPSTTVSTTATSIPCPVVHLYLCRSSLGFSPFMHRVTSAMIVAARLSYRDQVPLGPKAQKACCPQGGRALCLQTPVPGGMLRGPRKAGSFWSHIHVSEMQATLARAGCLSQASFPLTFACNPASPPNQLKIIKY